MRITRISFGRTYNTGSFTSYRFDLEVAVAEYDDPWDVLSDAQKQLDAQARVIMAADGVRHLVEPKGTIRLEAPSSETTAADDVEIPF